MLAIIVIIAYTNVFVNTKNVPTVPMFDRDDPCDARLP